MDSNLLYSLSDLALAQRLERTEARGNADSIEARAAMNPESGAAWIEIAGAYAMYDSPDSPITQTFGLGMFQPVTPSDMLALEKFFEDRGAPVCHEVSPLAGPSVLEALNAGGYHPIEFTSVMHRPIGEGMSLPASRNENLTVRTIAASKDEKELWARTSAKGWSEAIEFADLIYDLGMLMATKSPDLSFLAELNGEPIATGAMSICEGVALLAGASTLPEARNQGAQAALLQARLRAAIERGCDTAMMCAAPGSASQRNAERQGFRIAYTRIKWRKE